MVPSLLLAFTPFLFCPSLKAEVKKSAQDDHTHLKDHGAFRYLLIFIQTHGLLCVGFRRAPGPVSLLQPWPVSQVPATHGRGRHPKQGGRAGPPPAAPQPGQTPHSFTEDMDRQQCPQGLTGL